MPIGADISSKPIREMTVGGEILSNGAVKTIDQDGREVSETTKESAQEIAQNQSQITESPVKQEQSQQPSLSEKDLRKEYLEIQRLKRQTIEREKRSHESLKKAEAFEKAKALAESGEDPTALLRSAGLDPVKFYRDMTTYALSDKGKQEETDPVKRELNEHKSRLESYEKKLEAQERAIQDREELAAHNQVINQEVIPLLQNNEERYETLLMNFGANTAAEIYKTVWEIYQETGKARKFSEVADEMEAYWTEQVANGINNAYRLKKFQSRFAQSPAKQSEIRTERPENSNRSTTTLSNKLTTTASPTKTKRTFEYRSRDEYVADILKKFGD